MSLVRAAKNEVDCSCQSSLLQLCTRAALRMRVQLDALL